MRRSEEIRDAIKALSPRERLDLLAWLQNWVSDDDAWERQLAATRLEELAAEIEQDIESYWKSAASSDEAEMEEEQVQDVTELPRERGILEQPIDTIETEANEEEDEEQVVPEQPESAETESDEPDKEPLS